MLGDKLYGRSNINHEKYFKIRGPGKLCHDTAQRRWHFDAQKLLLGSSLNLLNDPIKQWIL
jgi:hypothetical protein